MKSLGNFPDPFIAEINGQPDALRRAARGLGEQATTLDRLADLGPRPTLIFTGMGSSYDACYPAITELAAARVPALHVDAAELLHFRRNLLPDATLLVMVSQSGESAEIVRIAEMIRDLDDPPLTLGVTNGADNGLARASEVSLDTHAGEESGPSTMTFGASLVVVAAIGRILSGVAVPDVIAHLRSSAETAAGAIEGLLEKPRLPDELAEVVGTRPHSVILGRGPARAAAEMGALTLKEAVGMPIESLETAQFRHGPLELAGPDLAAIVIATEPQTRDLDVGLAGELADAGAAVLLVVEEGGSPAGTTCIQIGRLDRALAPAASIVPAQLLAWRLAVKRGRPPGSYLRATKVTVRE